MYQWFGQNISFSGGQAEHQLCHGSAMTSTRQSTSMIKIEAFLPSS